MTTRDRGILKRLKSYLPVTRGLAQREFIEHAKKQVDQEVMHGTVHALSYPDPWWKAQAVKWETIWRMINEACSGLEGQPALEDVCSAAFALHEQLAVKAAVELCEVTADELKVESRRWRTLATHLTLLNEFSKKTANSGITDMRK
jgi:hypothetical protein